MIYPENYEDKLEFTSIRDILSHHCLCELGVQRVKEMKFSDKHNWISRQIRQTTEMKAILQLGDFPDQNFYDLRPVLRRIRIDKTFMDVPELFDLKRSLQSICLVVAYLRRTKDGTNSDSSSRTHNIESDALSHSHEKADAESPLYPYLSQLTNDVPTYPHLVKQIERIIDELGNIRDSASPELARIRREKASMSGRISRLLSNILQSAQDEGVVDKKATPTLRDGRLVIPVAPAMKRKISGIVHDESDTGRTVYIEPTEVVEANNRIRELENEERREIIRILQEISALIRPEIKEMLDSYEFLADVDFTRAKAKFALRTNAIEPTIQNKQVLDWSMARHPLLQLSFEKKLPMNVEKKLPTQNQNNGSDTSLDQPRTIVPLDIELRAPHSRILLISGPNAGGKSVCLKTVGLLQYMLQCGMPVPMAESSICGVFKSLFIDIGDEQSIENDLSTYSSHLLNMKMMLRHADSTSLLLIDEFGGGTEPQIGGAIAEAMLRRFNNKHAFGVITTHYQNLKHFAQETNGVQNAAMLYDRQQMQPLFQLRIGNPGSSFAVEIARKIGIPEDVIKDASDIVGADYINADKYLQDIVRDKRYWENKRQAIHQHEKRMEETIERYESDIEKLREEKRRIVAEAKEEALRLLQESNARIEQTIKDIKEAQAEKERTKLIRQDFADFKQEVKNLDAGLMEEKIARQMEKIKARQQRRADKKKERAQEGYSPTPQAAAPAPVVLEEGSYVRLKGQNTVGQISRINGNEAQVVFGSIQTSVKLNRLEPASAPKPVKRASTFVSLQTQDSIRETTLKFKPELDVRGMRTDEAIQAVTYFVDDALVASVGRLKILHGTGNGILRTMIRQYLNTLPAVSDFHDEDIRFGGAGITIVELL